MDEQSSLGVISQCCLDEWTNRVVRVIISQCCQYTQAERRIGINRGILNSELESEDGLMREKWLRYCGGKFKIHGQCVCDCGKNTNLSRRSFSIAACIPSDPTIHVSPTPQQKTDKFYRPDLNSLLERKHVYSYLHSITIDVEHVCSILCARL